MGGKCPIRLATYPSLPLRLEQPSFVVSSLLFFLRSASTVRRSTPCGWNINAVLKRGRRKLFLQMVLQAHSWAQSSVLPFFPILNTRFRLKLTFPFFPSFFPTSLISFIFTSSFLIIALDPVRLFRPGRRVPLLFHAAMGKCEKKKSEV